MIILTFRLVRNLAMTWTATHNVAVNRGSLNKCLRLPAAHYPLLLLGAGKTFNAASCRRELGMGKRIGGWIQTYSGMQINPLYPSASDICFSDIAHALSNICRFTGHCSEFYSVAQHSVHAAELVSKENSLWALLHDASEAYLCDIARPVKYSKELIGYIGFEKNLQTEINLKFGLTGDCPEEVKKIDNVLLVTEARDFGLLTPEWDDYKTKPLGIKINAWSPRLAKERFHEKYNELLDQGFCAPVVGAEPAPSLKVGERVTGGHTPESK